MLDELRRLVPRDDSDRLKNKLFQRLNPDIGHPRLREHLASVAALMRAASDWKHFYRMLDRALPVKELFEGKTVREGVVHVFDLDDHPSATRAYAWSSPVEGSKKRRFFAACIWAALSHRWMRYARPSW